MREKVVVLGAGGWGTALAVLLAGNGHRVWLWGHSPEYMREIERSRENRKFLPGVRIPRAIEVTTDAAGALARAGMAVLAVPTQFIRPVLRAMRSGCPRHLPFVSVAKGIENRTLLRPSQIVGELLGRLPLAVLSGPSHSEEVARGMPASVVVASHQEELALRAQAAFMNGQFRVYTQTDVVGVEFGAAAKNVVAIAAGICEGLGLGDNAKSALMARGLVEMARLGVVLGARKSTFFGLSGVGDLVTTCVSRFGRNREVGMKIGQGMKLHGILARMQKVAEGVWTTNSIRALARRHRVEVPITEEVYRVLFRNKPPREGVRDLMRRAAKSEIADLV